MTTPGHGYAETHLLSSSCRDKLFCRLTCQLLKKSLKAAKAYMEGKRFRRAKGEGLAPSYLAEVPDISIVADYLVNNECEGYCRVS